MPRGDRTGPAGQGSRSGRGAGLCSGNSEPGFLNRFFGGRMGRGAGRGMRLRGVNRPNAGQNAVDQLRTVREQLNALEKRIKGIRKD